MGQEPRFLGCPCRVCLAGLARSRSTNVSDAAVLVKNKDSRVRVLGLILPPLPTLCGSGPQFPRLFSGASGSAYFLGLW